MKTVWVGGMDADAIAGWFSDHSKTFQRWLSFNERRELKQFAEEIERNVDAQRKLSIRSPGIDVSADSVRKVLALAKKAYQQEKRNLKQYGGTPGDRETLASYKDEVVDTLYVILKPIVLTRSNGDKQSFGIPREQIDGETYYTLWEKVPSGRWVIERSYKGRYILDALMDGIEKTWTTPRPYAVFLQGKNPNISENPAASSTVEISENKASRIADWIRANHRHFVSWFSYDDRKAISDFVNDIISSAVRKRRDAGVYSAKPVDVSAKEVRKILTILRKGHKMAEMRFRLYGSTPRDKEILKELKKYAIDELIHIPKPRHSNPPSKVARLAYSLERGMSLYDMLYESLDSEEGTGVFGQFGSKDPLLHGGGYGIDIGEGPMLFMTGGVDARSEELGRPIDEKDYRYLDIEVCLAPVGEDAEDFNERYSWAGVNVGKGASEYERAERVFDLALRHSFKRLGHTETMKISDLQALFEEYEEATKELRSNPASA
jgi:hypothetical protein